MERSNKRTNCRLIIPLKALMLYVVLQGGSVLITNAQDSVYLSRARLINIDSISLNDYYILRFEKKEKVYNVLSIKNRIADAQIIKRGHHYFLILKKMNSYIESGLNVTYLGKNLIINDQVILKEGDWFYSSPNIEGLFYRWP